MTDDTMSGSGAERLIGARLREARENIGMSMPEVSRALRIRQIYLQAIETDDYAALPGKTYVLGFLRSYAELLGLDAYDVVQHYRRQSEYNSLPQSPLNFPIRDFEQRVPRGAVIALSVLLAAGAIYGGSRYFGSGETSKVDRVAPVPDRLIASAPAPAPSYSPPLKDPASAYAAQMPVGNEDASRQTTPSEPPAPAPVVQIDSAPLGGTVPAVAPSPTAPVPSVTAAAPAPVASAPPAAPVVAVPAAPAAQPAKPNAAAKPTDKPVAQPAAPAAAPPGSQVAALPPKADESVQPKPRDIMVVARVDSWIEVRDLNNRPLVSLLLRVGDSYRVPSGANYRLVTGDLRGLEVRVDGVAVPQRGTDDGRLHRTMSLDADRLSAGSGMVE
jgi:cytoskeletal protein RodZ